MTTLNTDPYRIYIDFDDVLCETARLLLQVVKTEFGRKLSFNDIHTFNIGNAFELTELEVQHVLDIMHKPENLIAITPMEMAIETINSWSDRGFKVDIVTGRPPTTEETSHAWLKKHNIKYSDILFVNKYSNTKNGNGFRYHDDAITLDELKNCHYDLAIDDSASMLQFLFAEMKMDVAVFHRPWNASLQIPPNNQSNRRIERCRSWQEIYNTFGPSNR